jgi:hypothetical protein
MEDPSTESKQEMVELDVTELEIVSGAASGYTASGHRSNPPAPETAP